MKLTVAVLAAVAESSRRRRQTESGHNVPDLECSADLVASSVSADGESGTVSMHGFGNDEHCFVNLGEQCEFGVGVEITNLLLDKLSGDDEPEVCYDSLFFAYTQNGEQYKTERQCGCFEVDYCGFDYHYDYFGEPAYITWEFSDTVLPTNYTLEGSDVKIVFYSDEEIYGDGSFVVDWKCLEPLVDPNLAWDICPSTKCYTQDQGWAPGTEVNCAMTNSDCLNVSCSANSIKATFDAELFHTNLKNEDTFMEQLESGHREIWYNGNKLDLNAPCGFTVSADGVEIDWPYDLCNVNPTMNENDEIVYSVSLSSPGNAPGYPTIEFYVDTAVAASCAYDSKVVVNADGFWVNQEDVEAAGNAMGKLDDTFHCKFYNDEARSNQILSNNIVNMGEMIYGQVTSDPLAGLSYELVGVTVTNANNLAMSFPVINGGVPNSDVKATSEGSALTGQSLAFSYLSFGFESDTGTNQNDLNIECAVDLFISACDDGFEQVGNNCFLLRSEADEKLVHKKACRELDANLAAPKNAAEQQELLDFLASKSVDASTRVWLGWNDGQNDGTYVLDNSKGAVLMPWDNFRAEDNENTLEKGSIVVEYSTGDWIRTDAFGNDAAVCSKPLN